MADPLSVTASIIAVLQLSSTVLRYLVDVNDALADRKSLICEISSTRGILSTLNETVDGARVSDETWSATIQLLENPDGPLNVLKTTLTQLAITLQGSALVTGIKKAANSLRWPFKQSEVEKILRVIERQKSTLSLALENDHIALSREVLNNTEAIRNNIAGLSREFAAAWLDAKTDAENAILNQLPYADGAPFNVFRHDYERTGKSTISRTVARHFAEQGRLRASFFFSRGQGDLDHAEKFFTTIVSQIAHTLSTLKRHICKAVTEDHRIGTQGLSEQWKQLIFRPLSKLENLSSHRLLIILVIDAPEVPIFDEFSVISKLTYRDFILHHISTDIIEYDILIFIQYKFERIRRERGLLSDWPKAKDINSLIQDANRLFIYAATICRFIDRHHPEKQLSIILQCMRLNPLTLRTSPMRKLDEMYSQVLKSSIHANYDEEEREELVDLFKQTVGSIVILSDTLCTTALTNLLNLPRGDVDEILKHVQAVLDVPDSLDLPVCLLHPSFRDFLLNK
ncbi:hypothetical protein GP486_004572 [Trichoglossum hirsutum]|uniref:Nephrocystin 3-like N-terminal domain-containing protein n=1 Tax=Trichoglossum hirsutum TaxID=265104 RepID=A0A9P8RPH9_9PEZI|nr:hypothetical protein GP486_004572 [Trichoglossum hirsutum]